MDVSPITNQIINAMWYLIPLAILTGTLKSPWFKGVIGEFQVNLLIKFMLPKDQYHLIKNTTLPTEDGTTQIDHIIVSKFGIFVIETKNMKGWIFGNPKQAQWTQQIYKHKSRFQNPIHQNYKHTKTLESSLNLDSNCIFSVIVFIGNSTFKTTMPENVTYAGGCIRYIKSKQNPVFSNSEVSNIIDSIETGRLERGFKTNREHVAHVKNVIANKKTVTPVVSKMNVIEKVGDPRCPKCDSTMVLRESKKGKHAGNKFWGCSTFPKCRSVVNC
ncbi:MAG: NERD domain-containing protein [Gammaproteobacteria bacterium]|nr:NERD domain-containing protein [Gammaproteobacteria bacterium]